MNALNINEILNRQDLVRKIRTILWNFEENCSNVNFKKGIYIYGSPGAGKTHFITQLLKDLGYDVIKYDAGDVRNKSLIDTITSNNISSYNVLDMLRGKQRRIAIVMDEIDGMNSGDKGGITSLIKLIRQKKTKKQKTESVTLNPIICIGNYFMDKKIRELMKVCNVFELNAPNNEQMERIVGKLMPTVEEYFRDSLVNYIQGDMRKLKFIYNIYEKKPELINDDTIRNIFQMKSYNDNSKNITSALFEKPVELSKHNVFMNETERTIVALLWHENIVDIIDKIQREKAIPFYLKILDNICYADYIDRITFQNQIWLFNEMTSLMKTFCNNSLFHVELNGYSMKNGMFVKNTDGAESAPVASEEGNGKNGCLTSMAAVSSKARNQKQGSSGNGGSGGNGGNGGKKEEDVRFTKVLTKYSTEYNNMLFVYMLCQTLDLDKKDIVSFFQEMRLVYGKDFCNQTDKMLEVEQMFDGEINKLDIKRMYRYLDKSVKRDVNYIENEMSDADEDDDLYG
jgi:hypothetical protein